MGWIQIFDQLVAFSESANEPILEALDHHFNFGQSSLVSELLTGTMIHYVRV